MKRLATVVLISSLCLLSAQAQVPTVINYQGRLINGTNLVNAVVGVSLRIYTNNVGGTMIYEDSNNVAVADGLYSTFIGDGTTAGNLTNALAAPGDKFIEVAINGTALSPRERLAAVAYAMMVAGGSGNFVQRTGDTMTGALNIDAGASNALVIGSSGSAVMIGHGATAEHYSVSMGFEATSRYSGVALGYQATAVGESANGVAGGIAIGIAADGGFGGIGIGNQANGDNSGTAVGAAAVATNSGVAIGVWSAGDNGSVAIGDHAWGVERGVAVGTSGSERYGVAIGYIAYAATNGVAIGQEALAGVSNSVAIGMKVHNDIENSARLRGTLYLDGATGIYYRSTFGSGGWTPVGASSTSYVQKAGDTMTGTLTINEGAGQNLTIQSAGSAVSIGNASAGSGDGTAVGYGANGAATGAGIGYNANGSVYGVAMGYQANGTYYGTAMGSGANGTTNGAAIGRDAKASGSGAALGYAANGENNGVAVGNLANAYYFGAAVGDNTYSYNHGVAVGDSSRGDDHGAAVGSLAVADMSGVAVGRDANGSGACIAVGAYANSAPAMYSIAVGYDARVDGGSVYGVAVGMRARVMADADNATAIGYAVTNTVSESTRVRGDLYIDGGSSVYTRPTFGSGSFSVKAFTIDHPLDPQNKVLRHYCAEGPVVQNIYNGTAMLDARGEAAVELPAYFDKLNTNPQYLLTPVGAQMNLFVKQEIADNRFVIGGGVPGGKVCWEIKAQRNDPAAIEDLKQRPVEQLKSELKPGQAAAENATVNADASKR